MNNFLLFDKRAALDWQLIGSLPVGALFHRASGGTGMDARQMIASVAIDVPRFDYDLTGGQSLGLLIEPQSTNIFPYSTMTGDQGGYPDGWSLSNMTGGGGVPVASRYGNADGAVAWSFTVNNARAFIAPATFSVAANTTYTYSALVESNPNGLPAAAFLQFINYPSGAVWAFEKGNNYVPSAGERLALTLTVGATAGGVLTRFGMGVDSARTGTVVMSRPQLEVNVAKASSYIPTTSNSAVTRAADQLGLTVPSGVSTLRYVFDDWSVQDVAVTAGAILVPTNLNQSHVRRIISR